MKITISNEMNKKFLDDKLRIVFQNDNFSINRQYRNRKEFFIVRYKGLQRKLPIAFKITSSEDENEYSRLSLQVSSSIIVISNILFCIGVITTYVLYSQNNNLYIATGLVSVFQVICFRLLYYFQLNEIFRDSGWAV